MTLSLALGITLEELRDMPASDYQLYCLRYKIDPFCSQRDDWRFANLAHVLYGANCKEPPPYTTWLWREKNKPPKVPTKEELKAKLLALAKRGKKKPK